MYMDQRTAAVHRLLADFVRSPSLRHIRDPHFLTKLALEIVKTLDQDGSVWRKWEGSRDTLLSSALDCWIPKDDLLEFLNSLPGQPLTMTDLEQRMRHLIEVEYIASPEPELQGECLDIYQSEKSAGTEMPAIIGRLSDYVGSQWQRLQDARHLAEENRLEAARLVRERRLLSYGDCPWTQIKGSKFFYCRKNGRVFRLKPNSDNSWNMYRVAAADDNEVGEMIGRYRSRTDANKVVSKAAYEPEPWR